MPTRSYLQDGAFGPDATSAMGEAFDAACKDLQIIEQADARRTVIAALIIAAARQGELNPVYLRTTAVTAFVLPKSPKLDTPKIKAAS